MYMYMYAFRKSPVAGSDTTVYVVELYENIAIAGSPVPTCANRPNIQPVVLEAIGSADHVGDDCTTTDTRWVYCIDALCDTPINDTATCSCWNHVPGTSVAPGSASSGATCVMSHEKGVKNVFGENPCNLMKADELIWTFGARYGIASYVPEFASVEFNGEFWVRIAGR